MKQLILLRHAEAAEKLPNQSDKDRELTPVGKLNAKQIGAYLHREKILPDVLISSDAKRAQETSAIVALEFSTDPKKIIFDSLLYKVDSTKVFLEQTNMIPDRFNSAMLIGHNPIFSVMAEYFTKSFTGSLPPAGAIVISFPVDSWKEVSLGSGSVVNYIYPAMIKS
jgi:phosphohistidine phosphatase